MRRMKALINDLAARLPQERHFALRHWEDRLQTTIARSFEDAEEKLEAAVEATARDWACLDGSLRVCSAIFAAIAIAERAAYNRSPAAGTSYASIVIP